MVRTKKTYDREYKLEVLELVKSSGKNMQELERELGLGSGVISRWRKEVEQEGEQAFPGKGYQVVEDERMRQLERENAVLRQERDILKKVVEIFSRDGK
jgi:transposase